MTLAALAVGAVVGSALGAETEARPIPEAHSHNDYLQRQPWDDALALGFRSIEVDLFRSAGRFLVGHRAADLRPERSLERLYLDRLRALGDARPNERPLTLVLDVKSGLPDGLRSLDALLADYATVLSQRVDSGWVENRVTVLVSRGGLAPEVERRRPRFFAVEGRPGDLGLGVSPSLMPQIAADWRKWFSWKSRTSFPDSSRRRLVAFVRRVHGEGRRLRFWNTPDDTTAWRVLLDAGVDVIGTDDLPKLRAFIAARAESAHNRP